MSKAILAECLSSENISNYSWNLYFFKINHGKKGNPYYVYKYTFKRPDYLSEYISSLCNMVIKYQIEPLELIQNYDGMSGKIACDKLNLSNRLISEQWTHLFTSVSGSQREQIKGKYQGYILEGQPADENKPSLIMVKTGNPIISLDKKGSKVFNFTMPNELDHITADLCRLYLKVDFLVIQNTLYSFNHNFESIFDLQRTLQRLKGEAIERIIGTNAFYDKEKILTYMKRYPSPKTFITLREQRMAKLNTLEGRKEVAEKLHFEVEENNEIVIDKQEQAFQLIKYLCFKIIQDKETDNLVEVSSVINDNVLRESM